MTKAKMLRRLLCLALALALFPALLPQRAVRAEGKTESDMTGPETLQKGYYAVDTLPQGILPKAEVCQVYIGPEGNRMAASSVSVEWLSGDFSPEDIAAWFMTDQNYIVLQTDLLTKQGSAQCVVRAEDDQYIASQEFTFRVFDYNEDPITGTDQPITVEAETGSMPSVYRVLAENSQVSGDNYAQYSMKKYDEAFQIEYQRATAGKPGTYNQLIEVRKHGAFACIPVTFYVSLSEKEKNGTEEPVTVKNFEELKKAVTETWSNRIIISAKYKHGKVDDANINIPHGRTVTFSPEDGQDSAVINGRLRLSGSGHAVFDRVSIEGTEGDIALQAVDGIEVTIGTVRGADSKKKNGGAAVFASNARVKVDEAIGGNTVSGLGGDAVIAVGSATVEVGSAAGGYSDDRVGGAGVIAMDGAQVTVTGDAVGGNGGTAPGEGVLAGLNGTVQVQGAVKNGEETESKKKTDPDVISDSALLHHALRSGKTEIVLSPKMTWTAGGTVPFFTATEETIRIKGPDDGKPVKVKDASTWFCCGSWEVSGLEITSSVREIAVYADGHAQVAWKGNVKATGYVAVGADKDAVIRMTGNVESGSKNYVAVGTADRARIEITGNVTQKGGSNAAIIEDSSVIVLNGNVNKSTASEYAAVYMVGGRLEMTGNLASGSAAIQCHGGSIRYDGDLTGKTKNWYLVYINHGNAIINGTIKAPYPYFSQIYGDLFINGLVCREEEQDSRRR